MKNLKCLFTNVFDSVSRFLNQKIEMPGAKSDQTEVAEQKATEPAKALEDLKSKVEGAEEVPLAQLDETTKVENIPTVPKVVPESKKEVAMSKSGVVGAEQVKLAEVSKVTPLETVPKAIPESEGQSQEVMLAAEEQKKKEEAVKKEREEIAALNLEQNQ